jgi:hypothetical protein
MIKARAVISGSCADAGMYGLNEEADVSFGIELPFLLSMKSPYCCIPRARLILLIVITL